MDQVSALEARELYRFFHAGDDETLALRGVSLEVLAGETVAVVGPSGSGKSTLLHCLAGLDTPDGGSVRIAGEPLSRRTEAERARIRACSIGILFQSANLIEHLDIAANIAFVQRLAGVADSQSQRELVARVGLSERAHSLPAQLSGGELARAGLAVALANDPCVLLADEPTGELDSTTAEVVLALFRERASRGCAVVVVSHNPAVAAAADRVVDLVDGRLVA